MSLGSAGPAQRELAHLSSPDAVVAVDVAHRFAVVAGAWGEFDVHARRRVERVQSAQQDGPALLGRVAQRLTTFDLAVLGDPAAAPDHRPFFVVATPYVTI